MKTLREKLDAGERIPVSAAKVQEALENVKSVGIHHQLRELSRAGLIEERVGSFKDSMRYFYRNRPVKIHAGYVGKSTWHRGEEVDVEFTEPHDVVVDKKTKQVLCAARTQFASQVEASSSVAEDGSLSMMETVRPQLEA